VTPVATIALGPEILPGTREYEWVRYVVEAVVRRTGRPSSWNRRLYEDRTGVLAAAVPNGPMSVSRAEILNPVMRAYDAPATLSHDGRRRARLGVAVIVHETDHHQAELGDDSAPDAIQELSPEDEALSEGLAEVKATSLTGLIMQDIQMDQAIPGSIGAFSGSLYPGFQAGVDGVLTGLHRITGLPRDDVLSAIEQTPRLQRYNTMADLVIATRLAGLMPPAHMAQVRKSLSRPLRQELAGLHKYESPYRDPLALDGLGREFSARAIRNLERTLGTLEQQYRQPADGLETAHLRQFLDNGSQSDRGAGAAAGGGAAASGTAAAAPPAWRVDRFRSGGGAAR
jgi:hypothetical protein